MTVYEEGTILHSKVLPIGGESVTNDIAIGLKTSIESAEKSKSNMELVNLKILIQKNKLICH